MCVRFLHFWVYFVRIRQRSALMPNDSFQFDCVVCYKKHFCVPIHQFDSYWLFNDCTHYTAINKEIAHTHWVLMCTDTFQRRRMDASSLMQLTSISRCILCIYFALLSSGLLRTVPFKSKLTVCFWVSILDSIHDSQFLHESRIENRERAIENQVEDWVLQDRRQKIHPWLISR